MLRPSGAADAEILVETRYTKERTRREWGDPESIERGVRQLLAEKVSGHLVGLWLLVAEHLRLGTWDLLCGWTGRSTERLEPRLALQMVHEAALCARGVRENRTLTPLNHVPLVLADAEHCCWELLDHVRQRDDFELLVPMPSTKALRRQMEAVPPESFTRRWAGYATTRRPYRMRHGAGGSCVQSLQRSRERPEDWHYKAFASTIDGDEVESLTVDFPKRWHIEEYFNTYQSMGWDRAGTMNLNIRYGQMTMALIAQTVPQQLRLRLGEPIANWDAHHFAKDLLRALDGDIRVSGDTIIVTYYNAPNAELLRRHYQGLPDKLAKDGVSPKIPWLYDFQLDFRFR